MAVVIEAVYEHGVFRPRARVALAEGQVVEVLIPETPAIDEEAALADLMSLAGLVHGTDADAASQERVEAALVAEYPSRRQEN